MNKYLFSLSCLFLLSCEERGMSVASQNQMGENPVAIKQEGKSFLFGKNDYHTEIKCDEGDVITISMSKTGENFEILMNGEELVSSENLNAEEMARVRPIVTKMTENLRLHASAEDFFKRNKPKKAMGLYQVETRKSLQVPRMQSRLYNSKDELLKNVSEMMRILIDYEEKKPEAVKQPSVVRPKVASKTKKLMCLNSRGYQRF